MKKIFALILILSLLLLAACKPNIETPPPAPTPPVETAPVAPPTPPPVETPESNITIRTQTASTELITEARCVSNSIEAVLNNPSDQEITLIKDMQIVINGLVVSHPDCDKNTIAAGESVYCRSIGGSLSIKKGAKNIVLINFLKTRNEYIVDCTGQNLNQTSV